MMNGGVTDAITLLKFLQPGSLHQSCRLEKFLAGGPDARRSIFQDRKNHFPENPIVEPVSAGRGLRFRETGFRGQRISAETTLWVVAVVDKIQD